MNITSITCHVALHEMDGFPFSRRCAIYIGSHPHLNQIGPGSEPDRPRIGTGLEPDRKHVASQMALRRIWSDAGHKRYKCRGPFAKKLLQSFMGQLTLIWGHHC